jgi:hypothetical protein
MEHLSGLLGLARPPANGVLDHLQIEPDLPFEHLHLARRGATHRIHRMLLERIVHA